MTKFQWLIFAGVIVLTLGLYAATQNQLFGSNLKKSATTEHSEGDGHNHGAETAVLSTDTILFHAKEALNADQQARLNFLESSITRGDVADQKIHLYHQLAAFWRDTARIFEPFAWYTAEAARLENSEKSLTFAAHLFLNNLRTEEDPALRRWEASQAKDLFERSLNRNPGNDSSQVGLGATILFGGEGGPMEGIQKIRTVAERDTGFVYAQQILGEASMLSNQVDKAVERFERVVRLQPGNVDALLLLADIEERRSNKAAARYWYGKSLEHITQPAIRQAVEKRMNDLSK